jgi:hypothetical protein
MRARRWELTASDYHFDQEIHFSRRFPDSPAGFQSHPPLAREERTHNCPQLIGRERFT